MIWVIEGVYVMRAIGTVRLVDSQRQSRGCYCMDRDIRTRRLEMARLSVQLDDEKRRRLDKVVEHRGGAISEVGARDD